MKKILIAVSASLFLSAISFQSNAQQVPAIPVDPAVRIGHLDNGLTYYIRHHGEPKGQANFYIAQKVGSVLEEESQRGLAHFLEHMCFNGTEHFSGNGVIRYCESIGVKFGADLNAYTSIDETVYNIDNVPVSTTPSAIDSCLWILHDWADGLLLTDEDIDHERGVIHEEWRARSNAMMRMYEKILPELYPGNRYGQRLPIGTMEVVDNFPYQVLRDYYEKWYRPDQQGIVVVGDIDVDAIEAKIKDIFGTIAKPVDPAERVYFQIEDNVEPIISIAKDKEQPYAISYLFCKHDAFPAEAKDDLNYLVYLYAVTMAENMLAQRLDELARTAEPPFLQAGIDDDDFFIAKTKKAVSGVVITSETGLEKGISTIYRELLRAVRGGFTASEYERARAEYLTQIESQYNQRDKRKSSSFCQEYVRHFIDNEPIPGIEAEFALASELAPNIPVEAVNQVFGSLVGEGNIALACMLPDKEGISYPDEAAMKALLCAVEAEEIAPYEDKVSDEPLVSDLPAPGKTVKAKDSVLGYRHYVLSNGADVYLKTTDFNADEVRMSATSRGGISLYDPSEFINLKVADEVFTAGGLGAFSQTDLAKVLAGKKASVGSSINIFGERLGGYSTPKDFETMLQLAYLHFTSVREDEEAFSSWQNRTRAALKNAESNPMTALNDSLSSTLYQDNRLVSRLTADQVDDVDYARILEIGRERFASAADFDFIFTGNIDEATALPLFEKYIGSLPGGGKKEKADKNAIKYYKGTVSTEFEKPMEIPMVTSVFMEMAKVKKYNLKQNLSYSIARQVLTIVLLEEIREKEGGTYGISANGSMGYYPRKQANLQIVYQAAPDRYEYLNGRVSEIVKQFAEEGPSEENLAKAKEYLLKNYKENLRENEYWENALDTYLDCGQDWVSSYEDVLSSITAEDARKSVADILDQGNHYLLIMCGTPASAE